MRFQLVLQLAGEFFITASTALNDYIIHCSMISQLSTFLEIILGKWKSQQLSPGVTISVGAW